MSTHPDPQSFYGACTVPETRSQTQPETSAVTRHDGWTAKRQAAFLRELAATHNVSAAAQAVGMSRQSAYKLRARLQGEPFDKAWDAAFQTRFDALAEAALERAMNGVEVPHYCNGELVGTSRKYDERLTLALLAMKRDLLRPKPSHYDPASLYESGDLAGLIERVEEGPEHWRSTLDEEIEALHGPQPEASAIVAPSVAGPCTND